MSSSLLLAWLGLIVLVGGGVVPDLPETRIVNGHQINITDAPWQAFLHLNESYWCGGSIISTRWVLSAGHCTLTEDVHLFTIRIGSTHKEEGGAVYEVDEVVQHEKFMQEDRNDISVLKTKEEMTLDYPVRAVRLPERPSDRPPVNTTVTVSGWGLMEDKTKPMLLRAVDIVITDYENCMEYGARSPSTEICAWLPGQGSCYGDSGGPLMHGDLQVGIVTWGNKCKECGEDPGLYADVAYYRDWIKEHTSV